MTIPTRYRDVLLKDSHGELTITRNLEGGLLIYPRSEWEERRKVIMNLPTKSRGIQRLLVGNAQDVEIDSAGRVLIAPELRNIAGIIKDVVLVGMGHSFELWDAERYAELQAKDLEEIDPDDLGDFVL